MIIECQGPRCDNETENPVMDPDQVAWVGERNAQKFCSPACLTNAAEDYWTDRYTAVPA